MKCCVCKKSIDEDTDWICEKCEEWHHEACSGDNGSDSSNPENHYESAYSYCENCINK